MKRAIPVIVLVLAALLSTPGGASAEAVSPLTVNADRLEFDADGRHIAAEGHAVLNYEDITLRAAALTYDRGTVLASGGAELTTAEGYLAADWISFDLQNRAYTAEGIRGKLGDLFVRGARLNPEPSGGHRLEEAGVSRCDLAVPCYQLQAGRITLYGRKITIEGGWLALKGRRILPLPRLALDLDRVDDWPKLTAEIGVHGLLLGARFPLSLSPGADLLLAGEAATDGHYVLRPSLRWHPAAGLTVEPWLEQVSETGTHGGLDLSLRTGGTLASLSLAYGLSARSLEADLSVTGNARPLGRGSLSPGVFLSYAGSSVEETNRAGAVLRWSAGRPGRTTALSLTVGGTAVSGLATPNLIIGAAIDYRLNEAWSIDADLAFDAAENAWDSAEWGLTRHLHCFYLRLGHDPLAGQWGLTGGINF